MPNQNSKKQAGLRAGQGAHAVGGLRLAGCLPTQLARVPRAASYNHPVCSRARRPGSCPEQGQRSLTARGGQPGPEHRHLQLGSCRAQGSATVKEVPAQQPWSTDPSTREACPTRSLARGGQSQRLPHSPLSPPPGTGDWGYQLPPTTQEWGGASGSLGAQSVHLRREGSAECPYDRLCACLGHAGASPRERESRGRAPGLPTMTSVTRQRWGGGLMNPSLRCGLGPSSGH